MIIVVCLFLLLAGGAMGEEDGGKPSLTPAAKALDRAILHAELVGKDSKKQARLSRLKQSLQKIAAGGDVDEARANGMTALMDAVRGDQPEAAAWLLEMGADIGLKTKRGKTALDFAKNDSWRRLFDEKAQVRSIDDALALVRRMKEEHPKNRDYGYLEDLMVKWQNGAAWDDLWGEGYTVLSLAVDFENVKIVEFILSRGVPKKMLDTSVPSAQSPDMLDLLLAHGADINSRDVLGYGSVAEMAAYRCDKRMIDYLLKKGVDLNRPGRHCDSTLSSCVPWKEQWIKASDREKARRLDMFAFLLDRGASPDWWLRSLRADTDKEREEVMRVYADFFAVLKEKKVDLDTFWKNSS